MVRVFSRSVEDMNNGVAILLLRVGCAAFPTWLILVGVDGRDIAAEKASAHMDPNNTQMHHNSRDWKYFFIRCTSAALRKTNY